jgi:hypothetical protein
VNTKRPRGVPSTKKTNALPNHRDFRSPLNPNVYFGRLRRKTQGLGLSPENANAILEVDRELLNAFRDPRNLSLDIINRFIERHYELISEDRATRVVGDSRRKMSGFEFNNDDNFEVMHSSANNLDCLFHSFLTATCPNFRRCKQHDKDEFANFFRRVIFLTLPVVQAYAVAQPHTYNQMLQRIMERDFLAELEIKLLAAQFHIRLLFLVNDDGDSILQFIDANVLALEIPSVGQNTDDSDWPIICLFTDMTHYESIRVNENYILTLDNIVVRAKPRVPIVADVPNNIPGYNPANFGPNVVPSRRRPALAIRSPAFNNMVGTRRSRGSPPVNNAYNLNNFGSRRRALADDSVAVIVPNHRKNHSNDNILFNGVYTFKKDHYFTVTRGNENKIKFTFEDIIPSFRHLNRDQSGRIFNISLNQYQNFLENIVDQRKEWIIYSKGKRLLIPGTWREDTA